jgi:hypothetical protein
VAHIHGRLSSASFLLSDATDLEDTAMTTCTRCSQAFETVRSMVPSKRSLALFGAALLVAMGAFWIVILTSPPQTSATQTSPPGVPVFEIMRGAPAMPELQADTI